MTPPSGPQLVALYPPAWLQLERSGRGGGGGDEVEDLRVAATAVLTSGPWTVTSSRSSAPGGDRHQYVTLSRYWWPTAGAKDGLPYVRRDGRTDPRVRWYPDETYLDNMVSTVDTLARAYSVVGDEDYAARAATLLKVFFLDPATAMAPDATWGQFVPGQSGARSDGILDTRVLIDVVDDLTLLRGARSWTAADGTAMSAWLGAFLHWLVTSGPGRAAAGAANNHGTWYDAEVAAIALYVGQRRESLATVSDYVRRQLGHQVSPSGSQPLELARTNSWFYSTFNLEAGLELAAVGRLLGYDIFDLRTASGASLARALDYLLPYATGSKRWPEHQIDDFDASAAAYPAWMAAVWFDDRSAAAALKQIPSGPAGSTDGVDPLDPATLGTNA